MRRRSKRLGRGGAEQHLPGNRARVKRGERVDAAVQHLVSLPGGLEPVAHGMAADETGADLLAG
jgi:hypothetical protein